MKAIIFIAPPGAGKGTQAEELSTRLGLFHLETSKLGEQKINDPELLAKDPETKQARDNFYSGKLFPPSWTTKIMIEEIKSLAEKGRSVVFSGSPRTVYEAENEIPALENIYGRENIKIFYIKLSEDEAIKRNSERRICQASRHPIPRAEYKPEFRDITVCPWDGSPIITRELDKPEVIKERYRVFWQETHPVLDYMKRHGYEIIEIEGEQPIETVTKDILNHIDDHRQN